MNNRITILILFIVGLSFEFTSCTFFTGTNDNRVIIKTPDQCICSSVNLDSLTIYNDIDNIERHKSNYGLIIYEDSVLNKLFESEVSFSNLRYLFINKKPNSSDSIFSDNICSYNHLNHLLMPNGYLNSLPECIGNLDCLENLDLSGNKIGYIPNSIGKLQCLKELNLYNNPIKILPDSFTKLTGLKNVYLGGEYEYDNYIDTNLLKLTSKKMSWCKFYFNYNYNTVIYQDGNLIKK